MTLPVPLLVLTLVAALHAGGGQAWDTSFDDPFIYECSNGRVLYYLFSEHNNHREDRRWNFGCRAAPAGAVPYSCYWTGYVNEWDRPMNFQCAPNYLITAVYSYHDNHREDRRYKFKCCSQSGYETTSCSLTSYINNWDGELSYTVPAGRVLTGVSSVHDNHREDRRFKFNTCSYRDANN